MTNEERQQAIEWLKRRPVMMAGAKRMYDLAVEALEAYVPDMNVGKLPTVQPKQPKRGYWCGPFCSECGVSQYNWFTVVSKKSEPIGHWDFCPGCGAKMEER